MNASRRDSTPWDCGSSDVYDYYVVALSAAE